MFGMKDYSKETENVACVWIIAGLSSGIGRLTNHPGWIPFLSNSIRIDCLFIVTSCRTTAYGEMARVLTQ